MNDDQRRQWYAMRAKSESLLDTPAPEPTRDLFRPDALEAWSRNMPKVEREPPPPERKPAPAPAPDWSAEIERAVEAAIAAERERNDEALREIIDAVNEGLEAVDNMAERLERRLLQRNNADQRSTDTTADNVTALPPRPGVQRRMRA